MAIKAAKKYPQEIETLLVGIVDEFDLEDQSVRQTQIRNWRRLKLLWENFQNTYYDDVAHDWRIPQGATDSTDTSQDYYDKPINIFRAYLESIIAALSITIPAIKCFPDDADNSEDLLTARSGDQIYKLISRHNDVSLLWLHALFVYCTEGMVACYNYSHEDEKYGTFEENEYEDSLEEHEVVICPNCRYEIEDNIIPEGQPPDIPDPTQPPTESPEMDMSAMFADENPMVMGGMQEEQDICPSCGTLVNAEVQRRNEIVSTLVRKEIRNKSRQLLEAYGGLYVKIPVSTKCQADIPYLSYSRETHYCNLREKYPDCWDKITPGVFDPYEVWGRLSPQYHGDYPRNNVTERSVWLRPAAFNTLEKEAQKKLKKLFPNGVKIVFSNDNFLEARPEVLDDFWTITRNPLSDYIHHDPLGLLLVSVQEITNDLISLTLQTVEHGIGQTFADPSVLDFKAYRQMEAVPGGIYPAKTKAGKSIGDGFYELKTATLSREVQPFGESIQTMGQMASGALPSLFGGAMEEQKTASGYAMSRAQALQRLQNTWKMFTVWWKVIFSKAIPRYIENLQEDERDVQRSPVGGFVNVLIRKADLQGKIGKYELEANENLPLTWSQRKDTVMKLIELNNPEILEALSSPENMPLLREAIGLDDFFIPGEDDRNKQFEEITLLLNSQPITIPGMGVDPTTGAPAEEQEFPSLEVDAEIDNHQIEFEVCRNWLVSDAGRLAKVDNELGYRNVLLHAKMHLMIMQEQAMMAQAQANAGAKDPEKPKEDTKAPIGGEADVKQQV
jgi:hypothetical protein